MAFHVDRRHGQRFPLRMDVTYRIFLPENGRILSRGEVKTVDISRTGVLLNTTESWPPGADAELVVEWPSITENVAALQLRLVGAVVRTDARGMAVKIVRYGFKRVKTEMLPMNESSKPTL